MDENTTIDPSSSPAAIDVAGEAANPSSFSVEGLSQTNRPLGELISADKYLRKLGRAGRRRHPLSGIGIAHVMPPGP